MIGRMYHESGQFFVPQESVVQITCLSRPTVSEVTKLLVDKGYLKIIKGWSYTNQQARTYYMGHLVANSDDDSQTIQTLPEDSVSSMYQWTMRIVDRLSNDIPM